jgi:hypothetical protein
MSESILLEDGGKAKFEEFKLQFTEILLKSKKIFIR